MGPYAPPKGGNVTYSGPPIGSIRWDGTSNDPTLPWYTSAFGAGGALFNQFNFRRSSLWDNGQIFGAGVDTQTIVDNEILAARNILDFWFFDRYPTTAELNPDFNRVSEIDQAWDAYMASPHKNDIKFCWLLQVAWLAYPAMSWTHFVAQCNSVAAAVADPQYHRVRVGNAMLPVIGLGFESVNMDIGHWNTFLGIVGPVYLVIVDGNNTAATTLGANAVCNYGPRLMPAGNGQHAWTEQAALNEAAWIPTGGRDPFPNAIVLQDRRTFDGTATPWVDQPSQPQLVNQISAAIAMKGSPKSILVHAWDEIAESGPGIVPGVQELTRYLDAITWLRDVLTRPSSYTYEYSCHFKGCVQSGTFAFTQPLPGGSSGIVGNYNSDEMTSVTTGDYVEFTHPKWITAIFYTVTGPDRGIAEILVNGIVVATVDLYSAVQTPHVAVWTHNFVDPDSMGNTVRVRVTGTKNGASSSVKIGYNTFGVTYDPHC